MKKELMQLDAALSRGKTLPYALVRGMSGVTLGKTPDIIPTDDLLEARFFSETEEIRVFCSDDGLHAAILTEEPGDVVIEARYTIGNSEFGKALTVHQHLGFDEDGQAFVETVCPVKWEGGNANG